MPLGVAYSKTYPNPFPVMVEVVKLQRHGQPMCFFRHQVRFWKLIVGTPKQFISHSVYLSVCGGVG